MTSPLMIIIIIYDIKISAKKEKGLDSLIQTIRIFNKERRKEFGIEKKKKKKQLKE